MARYIDADKLILSMRECAGYERKKHTTTTWTDACESFIDEIEDLLVDDKDEVAQVIHAHWIHDGSQWKYSFICSNCGNLILGEATEDMPYCMRCGAKMDEPTQ